MIHIYCGNGKGKTTAATGLAVRAAGSGKRVLFVQFFKDGSSCEIDELDRLERIDCMYYPVNLGFFKNMSEKTRIQAKQEYQALFERAIDRFLEEDMQMIVLDEIMSVYKYNLIDRERVLEFLRGKKGNVDIEVVLTGRDPAPELLELGDYVSEIKKIKHPYDLGITARKGIEY